MGIEFDPSGFGWRSSWVNPLESLWSILRKFVFFNQATLKQMQDFFGTDPITRLPWLSRKRLDLRWYGGFDPLLLERAFGVSRLTLDESTVIPFVVEPEHDVLTSKYLRFCPSCLKEGFHSSLYQLLLVRDCPLHEETLEICCQHCHTSVDYTLRSVLLASDVGCSECFARPETDIEIRKRFSFTSLERDKRLRLAAELLRRRLRLETIVYPASKWICAKSSGQGQERRMSRLSRYWMDIVNAEGQTLDAPADGECYVYFDYRSRIPSQNPPARKPTRHIDLANEFDGEQRIIMKSIRRSLEKLWLGPHRKCVTYLARRESISVGPQDGKPCPYANVLILWRLYWQELDKLHHLLLRKRRWRGRGALGLHGRGKSFPRELLHRVFAIECLAVLEECCLLVKTLRRRSQHTFNQACLDDVAGRCMPYWIVEHRPDNMFRLHVWQRSNRSAAWREICFPGTPKPSREGKCDHSPSRLYERQYNQRGPFVTLSFDKN